MIGRKACFILPCGAGESLERGRKEDMYEQTTIQETCRQLDTDIINGLSRHEAAIRGERDGKNELKEAHVKTLPESFLEQLNDPLIYVLLAAAAVSFLLKEASDAIIILVVVFVNAVVGMVQEGKAQKALDSLKKLTSPRTYVIRDGVEQEIAAADLAVGDLVCLEAGCQVPADLRLVETQNLKTEEAALTGESLPIEKDSAFITEKELSLGDRKNMAFMSTMVTYGRGRGVVTAIGMDTQIGKIAAMIRDTKEEMTPLQKRLGDLGRVLSILSVLLCVSLFFIALIQKRNVFEMFITAISLAVAAVPEGLPAVVTICLALSVTRMVRVNTIVRRLPSVETLGAVNVVCSDKTGTLTQNKMTVVKTCVDGKIISVSEFRSADYPFFVNGLVLCNDAVLTPESRIGDPTELALLDFAVRQKVSIERIKRDYPRYKERAFDSDRKMMSTCHKEPGGSVTYTKGAPDILLKRCRYVWKNGKKEPMDEREKRQISKALEEMSCGALRTLAVAMRKNDEGLSERDMIFLGLAGMEDPVRPEAVEAIDTFRIAGVKTVMITGDHVDTAFAIGQKLNLVSRQEECMSGEELGCLPESELLERIGQIRVFARVSPEHKVRIVKAFKARGNIVAMTGDGVNDAPSLKSADIGIAMGLNGTDVAKQASDLILTDDNFATIEKAIEEGRGVYENIKKSVLFLLSSNFGEIMTMFAAVLCGLASPLKSSHILWINLITDSLRALALGVDKNDEKGLMARPPRKSGESLFAEGGLACTLFYGMLIAGISLTAFLTIPYQILVQSRLPVTIANIQAVLGTGEILNRAQTYAFTVLGMAQLFHAIGMRDVRRSVFRMDHLKNKLMIAAAVIGLALQMAVTEIPYLNAAFGTAHLTLQEWGRLGILAAFPLLAHEILILLSFDFRRTPVAGKGVSEMEN